MQLLICTQAIDRDDPALGFFHEWVEALAPYYEQIVVICLKQGRHTLPQNVIVQSLGKEHGTSRLTRVVRFFRYVFSYRTQYDAVFVHMNQEYILLAGWLWKLLGKRIYLWRNHYSGNFLTSRAARQCTKVFFTSMSSYTARYPNAQQMPVGVDIQASARVPGIQRDPRAILFLGRLAPSKRPELLLKALGTLAHNNENFSASFCGAPTSEAYLEDLKKLVNELHISEQVQFLPPVAHSEVPRIFSKHSIFVNCSPSGMYDKTMFEAGATECMVLASSRDFAKLVPPRFVFEDGNEDDLYRKLRTLLNLPLIEQQGAGVQMRNIAKEHDLKKLSIRLVEEMSV